MQASLGVRDASTGTDRLTDARRDALRDYIHVLDLWMRTWRALTTSTAPVRPSR